MYTYNLSIQMQSFELARGIVKDNDTIQVHITVHPGDQKKMFSFEAKKIRLIHQSFSVLINDKTEKILIVFRKKSFIQQDPIIASTYILSSQFPNNTENTGVQTINIYEPFRRGGNRNTCAESRSVLGKFDVQFSLSQIQQKHSSTTSYHANKKKNGGVYSKMSSNYDNENINSNYIYN